MNYERTFSNAPQAATDARHYTLGLLGDVDPTVAEEVAVMVSELATNSIRHAATRFTVAVDCSDGHIRIAVSDVGPGVPVVQFPVPEQPTGRGLRIIAALADDWGITAHAGTGKTVWFVINQRRATRPEPHETAADGWTSSADGASARDSSERDLRARAA